MNGESEALLPHQEIPNKKQLKIQGVQLNCPVGFSPQLNAAALGNRTLLFRSRSTAHGDGNLVSVKLRHKNLKSMRQTVVPFCWQVVLLSYLFDQADWHYRVMYKRQCSIYSD